MTRRLEIRQVLELCRGAVLLSAGTDMPSMAAVTEWARDAVSRAGGVQLRQLEQLADDEHVFAMSMVGAPQAMSELLPLGDEPARAIQLLEQATGHSYTGLAGLNLAGENAAIAAAAAASKGINLLDADGAGRVFPLLEQTTFTLAGISAVPIALVGATGDSVVVHTGEGAIESLVRAILPVLGGWAIAACYPMTGAQMKLAAVPGTVTSLIATGASRSATVLPAGVKVLARGRVTAIETLDGESPRSSMTFAMPSQRFSVVIREIALKPRHIRVETHNEVEVVFVDGRPFACAPDQIHLVAANEGRVIDPNRVLIGDRIDIVTIPADPRWHTTDGLALGRPVVSSWST